MMWGLEHVDVIKKPMRRELALGFLFGVPREDGREPAVGDSYDRAGVIGVRGTVIGPGPEHVHGEPPDGHGTPRGEI